MTRIDDFSDESDLVGVQVWMVAIDLQAIGFGYEIGPMLL